MDDEAPTTERSSRQNNAKTYGDIGKIPLLLLSASVVLLSIKFAWPLRWILSGSGVLSATLILGDLYRARILAFTPLWTQLALLNLTYSACATSWLFWWIFTSTCYPTILIACLFQFEFAASFVRKRLGRLLRQLHFINDKIALFNIPALEIDTDVEGLFVIRGITLSLSHLSIVAHGVEVGIKLSEDVELSIQVDEVTVRLLRSIIIGDVYANVKGGEFEMTFGKLARRTTGDSLMVSDTPLLAAAAARGNTTRPDLARLRSRLTNGAIPRNVSAQAGLESMTQISPDQTHQAYAAALAYIIKTSAIQTSLGEIEQLNESGAHIDLEDEKSLRAAICSQLHDRPSVPHPPLQSVKVTTLQNLSDPRVRRFLHRLPLLLRLLLNPLSYFHPIHLSSITAAGSGKWLQHLLHEKVFKHYGESDSGIRKLEGRVSSWLSDANFVLELVDINALVNVPMSTNNNILAQLKINDVLAYRTQPKEVNLQEVVRLGGADANVAIPAYLLPHHSHVLPAAPTAEDERRQAEQVKQADGLPKEVQAAQELERTMKDETAVPFSAHARLPAVLDQELLDFIAALVKAVKIIELEKDPEVAQEVAEILDDTSSVDSTSAPAKRSFREVAQQLNSNMKKSMKVVNDGMRRVGIDAVANDRFIAKLVGKITKKLETAQGDLGYSGVIPVPLLPYREAAEDETKLLP